MFAKISVVSEQNYIYKGIFDYDEIYRSLKEYLRKRGYDIVTNDYIEGNENGSRKLETKNVGEIYWNDYYKIILKYNLNMSGKVTEVKVNGVLRKDLVSGSIALIINAYIEPDYNRKVESHPFFEFFVNVYDYIFRKDELGRCKGAAIEEVQGLLSLFKQNVDKLKYLTQNEK